jgi:hypothetical protein
MDDYRDLVSVSLTLLCAGIILVAGQLYLQYRTAHPPGSAPGAPQISAPMVSRAPSPQQDPAERQQGRDKSHQT